MHADVGGVMSLRVRASSRVAFQLRQQVHGRQGHAAAKSGAMRLAADIFCSDLCSQLCIGLEFRHVNQSVDQRTLQPRYNARL